MTELISLQGQFIEYLKTEKGHRSKTIENYERYLERFLTFSKVATPAQLTEKRVQEFRLYLSRQPGTLSGGRVEPMKQRTQNYYLIAVRAFLKFLRERGIESLSPEKVELMHFSAPAPTNISVPELRRLMATPDTKSIEGKRDQAILELLSTTGLRISELCSLTVKDVNFSQNECIVRGSGEAVRVISIPDSVKKTLRQYLKCRKDLDEALFVRYGRKANDGGDRRLQPRAVQRLLKQYAIQAGITHRVTPQILRYTFAASLLSKGTDLRSVQIFLGHQHYGTTKIYAATAVESQRDESIKTHKK
jgi:site-specific recombinase XerD